MLDGMVLLEWGWWNRAGIVLWNGAGWNGAGGMGLAGM